MQGVRDCATGLIPVHLNDLILLIISVMQYTTIFNNPSQVYKYLVWAYIGQVQTINYKHHIALLCD